jgi:hypothetical protein
VIFQERRRFFLDIAGDFSGKDSCRLSSWLRRDDLLQT